MHSGKRQQNNTQLRRKQIDALPERLDTHV
jgi:hypothetical protein